MPLVGLYVPLTYPSCSEAQKIQKDLWEAGERMVEGREGREVSQAGRMGPWGQEAPLARGAPRASSEPACPGCPGPALTQKETFLSRYT